MEKYDIERGDVVQLNPQHVRFPCALVVVTEPKSFGCQGYLMLSGETEACRFSGLAYIRPKFEDFEFVGRIVWNEHKQEEDYE